MVLHPPRHGIARFVIIFDLKAIINRVFEKRRWTVLSSYEISQPEFIIIIFSETYEKNLSLT